MIKNNIFSLNYPIFEKKFFFINFFFFSLMNPKIPISANIYSSIELPM